MQLIYRPTKGRIVGGVALGISERYGISLLLVRLVIVALILVSQIGILVYVLLWISTPSESSILSRLRLNSQETSDGKRFEEFAKLAVNDLELRQHPNNRFSRFTAAILLLVIATVLQSSRTGSLSIESFSTFYSLYTFLTVRLGSAILYSGVALLFLIPSTVRSAKLVLDGPKTSTFKPDASESRALMGLVSGFASLTGIETSFLRVGLVIINFLTLGLAGLCYLLIGIYFQQKGGANVPIEGASKPNSRKLGIDIPDSHGARGSVASICIGFLFLLLGAVRIATEFRWFFFNEAFAVGSILVIIGVILSLSGLRHIAETGVARIWVLTGAALFLYGIFQLSIALFGVQLSPVLSFQLIFVLSGVAFIYYSIGVLVGSAQRSTLAVGLLLLVPAVIAQARPAWTNYLFSLERFYGFFYPLLFASCGLWLLVERGKTRGVIGD